jgi:integrator complex subunit 11
MSISVKPLGAGQEVGRSCVIVKIKDVKIMFDCGVHMAFQDHRKFPDFRRIVDDNISSTNFPSGENVNIFNTNFDASNTQFNPLLPQPINIYQNLDNTINYTKHIDLVIITHFHLDHCGALPYFTEICGYDGPIITSQPTKSILPLTLEDFRRIISDFKGEKSIISPDQITKCVNKVQTVEMGEEKIINNRIKVTSYYAGHVLGAGMYRVEVDGYSVVYTGDYNTSSDRHLSGAYLPKLYPNILITETTYGDTIRDTKRAREREFLKKIQSTIDKGGKVLIPIFALGRAQELCILLDTHWRRTKSEVPIYFAGPMAEKANFYYKIFTNWTNSKIQNSFLERNVFEFSFVKHGDKSVTKSNQPMVIFATPGMLHGGLSMSIFKDLAPDSRNCVRYFRE